MNQAEFDELTQDQQRCATEIGIAMTILATRIPKLGDVFVSYMVREFANSSKLSQDKANDVLEQIAHLLYREEWRFEITKQAANVITTFETKDDGEHGEHTTLPQPASLN